MNSEIPKHLEPYFNEKSQFQYYDDFINHTKQNRNIENQFICLKGFSSSTPLVGSAAFDSEYLGGGLYFRFEGKGIVIDPGIGFLTLMHRNNIYINDIDIVIVTHDHLDHNCDLYALSSLLYDYNQYKKRSIRFFSNFFQTTLQSHSIEWYLDDSSANRYSDYLEQRYVHKLSSLVDKLPTSITDSINLEVFQTKHITKNSDTYGIILEFHKDIEIYRWGYTSDTSYFDDLSSKIKNCDVGIINISDIYPKDILGIKAKKNHLGFDGCRKIIQDSNWKMALVSEFCCMNGDYRHEIIKALRKSVNNNDILILPAEKGLSISISSQKIRCSICGKFESAQDISCIKAKKEYGELYYICQDCII